MPNVIYYLLRACVRASDKTAFFPRSVWTPMSGTPHWQNTDTWKSAGPD